MLFLGERTASPITILKVEYPERFGPGEPNRFALNVLARKNVEDLKIEYSYLRMADVDLMEKLYQMDGFNESVIEDDNPEEFLLIPSETKDFIDNLPGEVGFMTQKVELPYEYRKDMQIMKTDLTLRFFDYRKMLQWAPDTAIPDIFGATSSFAVLSLPEGNVSYFYGVSDFYLNRPDSMSDFEFGKNESTSLFLNPRIREVSGDFLHINRAPELGTVEFGSLEKGQRAFMSFTTRDIKLPAIQVVRFWVNGELIEDDTQFNFMGGLFRSG
jgi:hypothetical protein